MKISKCRGVSAYFTSDLHIGHRFMSNHRGYDSVEEMNKRIISNWNSVVPEDADVFVLGDIFFGKYVDAVEVLLQLNGRLHLIRGNHDKSMPKAVSGLFRTDREYLEIDIVEEDLTKQRLVMFHFSIRSWNRMHYGSWHLFGHSHGNLPWSGRSMDVGLDAHNQYPISYSQVKEFLHDREIVEVDHHGVR